MSRLPAAEPTLRRELGRWDLTAIGVQSGDRQCHFPAAVPGGGSGGLVEPDCVSGHRWRVVARRAVLRRGRQPVRRNRRPLPLHAGGVRPVRRIRSRLDAVGDARHEPGRRLPTPSRWRWDSTGRPLPPAPAARSRFQQCTLSSGMDQPSRYPPQRIRDQSAHHRQAPAARALHRDRRVVHRSQPSCAVWQRSRCRNFLRRRSC